jgi:DNA-binding NarL/FixJ family response regulator
MTAVRTLLVDDHPLFRKGMRALLETVGDIEVIAEAASAGEAVELASELKPDVILMDLQIPEGGGLAATRRIAQDQPDARVLVLTMFDDDESVFAAMRAGARGYLLKEADEDEVIRAIRAVAEGEAIFSSAIATRLIDYFSAAQAIVPKERFPELTDREREILTLISRGLSNSLIAEQLGISLKTVRNHVSNVYSKLQVVDRAQAALRARDAGLS